MSCGIRCSTPRAKVVPTRKGTSRTLDSARSGMKIAKPNHLLNKFLEGNETTLPLREQKGRIQYSVNPLRRRQSVPCNANGLYQFEEPSMNEYSNLSTLYGNRTPSSERKVAGMPIIIGIRSSLENSERDINLLAWQFTGADGAQYFDKTSSNFCAPAGGLTLPDKISAGKAALP
jgi:hypothetical protein